jgi:hypothetical protein
MFIVRRYMVTHPQPLFVMNFGAAKRLVNSAQIEARERSRDRLDRLDRHKTSRSVDAFDKVPHQY